MVTSKWTWECANCLGNALIPIEYRKHKPCLLPKLCVTYNKSGLNQDQLKIVASWIFNHGKSIN